MKSVIEATPIESGNVDGVAVYKSGNVLLYTGAPRISGSTEWVTVAIFPDPFKPKNTTMFTAGTYEGKAYAGQISSSGRIQVYVADTISNLQVFINVTAI